MMNEQAGAQAGLERLAQQLAEDSAYMAWVLAEHRRIEGGLSAERLAERLGLSVSGYVALALCRRPGRERFADDVRRIADYTGADITALANLVRQVDVLGVLPPRTVENAPGQAGQGAPGWAARAMSTPLRAARDRLPAERALREEGTLYASAAPAPSAAPSQAKSPPAVADAKQEPPDEPPPPDEPLAGQRQP